MSDKMLRLEDFDGLVGGSFAIVCDVPDMPDLVLTEAGPLPSHGAELIRPPFSLVFDMPGEQRLDQGLYRMRNQTLGETDIFLVPMAKTAEGVRYAATFA